MARTKTSSFGTSNREAHDASEFYNRNIYGNDLFSVFAQMSDLFAAKSTRVVEERPREEWVNRIFCHTSEDMFHVPNNSVGLAFTSPPYNVGKEFDEDLGLVEYLTLIANVATEVYRVLTPGGRYVINLANLGRKPYIPLHSYFYGVHAALGFQPAGEIIWQKGKGMNGSCAWGSWMSAKSPRLRDIHEYLLVFTKEGFSRPDKENQMFQRRVHEWDVVGVEYSSGIGKESRPSCSLPVELADRVIKLFSYTGDVILDPFCGSGTTCLAAALSGRAYVGYDILPEYCDLSRKRIEVGK